MSKYPDTYEAHMDTVNFGFQVVEAAIANRNWGDARHYLAATKRHLAMAAAILAADEANEIVHAHRVAQVSALRLIHPLHPICPIR